jgi:hypothetical protein
MRTFILLSAVALIATFCTNSVAANQPSKTKNKKGTASGQDMNMNRHTDSGQRATGLCDIVGKNDCETECGQQMLKDNGQKWTESKAGCVSKCAICAANKAKAKAKGKGTAKGTAKAPRKAPSAQSGRAKSKAKAKAQGKATAKGTAKGTAKKSTKKAPKKSTIKKKRAPTTHQERLNKAKGGKDGL